MNRNMKKKITCSCGSCQQPIYDAIDDLWMCKAHYMQAAEKAATRTRNAMNRRIPSAREMEASRDIMNVVFDDGIARKVVYEIQPDGLWAAGLLEDPEAGWPGSGNTPITAIIDLLAQHADQAVDK